MLEIVRVEQSKGTLAGVIVQFGGQTPLKLANRLVEAGVRPSSAPAPMPSTSPKTASGFPGAAQRSGPETAAQCHRDDGRPKPSLPRSAIGFPVILRPSYVLGGRGMVVVTDETQLKKQVESGRAVFRISRRQSGADRRLPCTAP
ncbi:MAG: hypothetical protein WDM89_04540 [Rhizomicrobium sp.]